MSRKQQSLTLDTKQKILNEIDDKCLKKSEIASKFGVAKSTISMILKNREKIEAAYSVNLFKPGRKRMRTGRNEDVEIALMRWIKNARSQNLIVTGTILQEKANFFADALGVTDFTCSNGWLSRFKKRHGIVCKQICGEEEDAVDMDSIISFFAEKWPALAKVYACRDIFNAEEMGLFFKAHPWQTYTLKGEKCSGGNYSKERVTVLVACNMDGTEKIPLLVIGKVVKPQCFNQVKTLPTEYASSKNAWMNSGIFTKWLLNLDLKFQKEKRKVCLMLDNCTAHMEVQELKAINCVYLPPNTTAKLQPCNQGIIEDLKMHYRKEMVMKTIDCFDNQIEFSMNLLEAMCYLKSAWNTVSSTTIRNGFNRGGFKGQGFPDTSEEEPKIKYDLVIEAAENRGIITASLFEEYVSMDDDILTSDILTDQDIVAELSGKKNSIHLNESDSNDDTDAEPLSLISFNEAAVALKTVQNFLMQQDNASCALIIESKRIHL